MVCAAQQFRPSESNSKSPGRAGRPPWLQRGGVRGWRCLGVSVTLINVSQHDEPVSMAPIMHPGCLFAHREDSEKRQHMSDVGGRPGKKRGEKDERVGEEDRKSRTLRTDLLSPPALSGLVGMLTA